MTIYQLIDMYILYFCAAGRSTTNDELEDMLESGNPAIFTQGVSDNYGHINIKLDILFRYFHYKDEIVMRLSQLYKGNSFTVKMAA